MVRDIALRHRISMTPAGAVHATRIAQSIFEHFQQQMDVSRKHADMYTTTEAVVLDAALALEPFGSCCTKKIIDFARDRVSQYMSTLNEHQ